MPIVFRRSAVPFLLCLSACNQVPYTLDEHSMAELDGALPDSDPGLLEELDEPGHSLEGEHLEDTAPLTAETVPLAPQLADARAIDLETDGDGPTAQGVLIPGTPLTLVSAPTGSVQRTTVHLSVHWKTGEKKVCTGTLIAQDAVLTAAHCVYNAGRRGWAHSITATPARHGDAEPPYESVGVKRSFAPARYRAADPHPDKYPYDYGVVRLKRPFSIQPRVLGVGSNALGRRFLVRGYPFSEAPYDGVHMYESRDKIRLVDSNGVFYHRASTLGGMSGGGIDDGARILGVHTSGGGSDNGGVVFSPTTLEVVRSWATEVL